MALDDCASRVITIDADGQHDPAMAPQLIAALDDADVVIGMRARTRGTMPLGRRMTNALASAAVGAIVGVHVPDAQSGFRAMRREVLETVRAGGDRYEYETEFLIGAARAGYRIASVGVPTMYGAPSHFRAWNDSMRVVRTIWRHRVETRRLMRLLCTNDDGILALRTRLPREVAPNRSATSRWLHRIENRAPRVTRSRCITPFAR